MPHRRVTFKIKDIYEPDPGQILMELHGNDLLQGVIVTWSSGPEEEAFAAVEVEGLSQPVIVSMKRIKGLFCE